MTRAEHPSQPLLRSILPYRRPIKRFAMDLVLTLMVWRVSAIVL